MRYLFSILVLIGWSASSLQAGQLDRIEERANSGEKKSKASSKDSSSKSSQTYWNDDDDDDSFSAAMAELLFKGTFYGTLYFFSNIFTDDDDWIGKVQEPDDDYYAQDNPDAEESSEWLDGVHPHKLGVQVRPWLRADVNYQYINSTLDALDARVEAGYSGLAFSGRYTEYTESGAPPDNLEIAQYYGLLRMGRSPDVAWWQVGYEIGLGVGGAHINGNDTDSSWAFTLPIKCYPNENWGIEFRPAWYSWGGSTVGDYDLSTSVGLRVLQLRAGYRWLRIAGESDLDGPYVGVSVSF